MAYIESIMIQEIKSNTKSCTMAKQGDKDGLN